MGLDAFANRLRRNRARLLPFARKHDLTAWRLYDLDVPEFRCTVDVLADHAVVTALQGLQDDAAFHRALADTARDVLGLDEKRVHLKVRRRHAPGQTQYERQDRTDLRVEVREQGLRFLVNPADYLDTGLFMDHRRTRAMVRDVSRGRRVLNLFSYSGAFTVYAAAGGASSTVSVDSSSTYLQWGEKNLALNGLASPAHVAVRADVMAWLPAATGRFGVIVLDPPSFSTGRDGEDLLDIQRDHVRLVGAALRLLDDDGVLFFSTNLRTFAPAAEAWHGWRAHELTPASIPDDFRQRDLHRCWRVEAAPVVARPARA